MAGLRSMITTMHLGGFVAHLDLMTGAGVLVIPRASDDVTDPFGPGSVQSRAGTTPSTPSTGSAGNL